VEQVEQAEVEQAVMVALLPLELMEQQILAVAVAERGLLALAVLITLRGVMGVQV
jgi:hypothetical protein